MTPGPIPWWMQQYGGEQEAINSGLNDLGYPQGPIHPAMQQSPDLNLGPLHLNGGRLDSAAMAILQQLHGQAAPQGFGGGLVSGLAQGLAGGRVRQAMARDKANAKAETDAANMEKERRKAAATLLGQHRQALAAAAREAAKPAKAGPKPDHRIPATPSVRRRMAGLGMPIPDDAVDIPESEYYTKPDKPKASLEVGDFSGDMETDTRGRKYIDTSKYLGTQRQDAFKAAKALGAIALNKEQADAISQTDNAKLNISNLRDEIENLLPQDPAERARRIPGIRLSQVFQTSERRAAWGAYRLAAIQALRAAAGSKGLRINQAEIAASVANDIPQLTDTYPTAMKRLERLEKMLDNAADAVMVRDRSKMLRAEPGQSIDDKLSRILGGGR